MYILLPYFKDSDSIFNNFLSLRNLILMLYDLFMCF